MSLHIVGGAHPFTKRPRGTIYILATECSKPAATKAEIGNRMARILSPLDRAPSDNHTARHTSTLQRIPRKNARSSGSVVLASATLSTTSATWPSPERY